MELSKTYIGMVDRYINGECIGSLLDVDGIAVAFNSFSVVVFTPDGDGEHIDVSDFDGIKIGDYPHFKHQIWKRIIAPYWEDRTRVYKPMPITLRLDDIKGDVDAVHKEYEIPVRTKLYSNEVRNGEFKSEVALKYGGDDGIWLNPELLYDVAKLISFKTKPINIWIPNNKRLPAVLVSENKYGRHLGFVLGTVRNFKEDRGE